MKNYVYLTNVVLCFFFFIDNEQTCSPFHAILIVDVLLMIHSNLFIFVLTPIWKVGYSFFFFCDNNIQNIVYRF